MPNIFKKKKLVFCLAHPPQDRPPNLSQKFLKIGKSFLSNAPSKKVFFSFFLPLINKGHLFVGSY
jgi:hypothetical protein